jgi:transglutaminase-like putative cysteine protease
MTQLGAEKHHEAVAGTPAGHETPWTRVTFSPPGDWVEPDPYDPTLRGKDGDHVTLLLLARQTRAGSNQTFFASATRFETSVAVQRESQWSVELNPLSQRLTLHWLRVLRNGQTIDHLHRDRMRLIQRESGLEQLVIDGAWTLLMVLDDVRPGDVLETGYTYENIHPIRKTACELFFALPPHVVVGCYRLRATLDPAGPGLAFLASADAPERREETSPSGGLIRWVWEGSQTTLRAPEGNQPSTFLDYVWIQLSDLDGWDKLGTSTASAWNQTSDDTGLDAIPAFAKPDVVGETAINQLVQYIQDEFRYLSINLDAGGWIPASPAVVAKRRYGDCKDLAWLASRVLRRWGVTARPVLVSTQLRERVASLLPMAGLFSHAIMEVEFRGKTRWFDLTESHQGGNFTTRGVTWFGHGLQIDPGEAALHEQPGERARSLYAQRELILLDTTRGGQCHAENRVRAEGSQADRLRRERLHLGEEGFAKNREKNAANRYGACRRMGTLEWRDDRLANVCELAEAFELNHAISTDDRGERARFELPATLVLQGFVIPEEKPRRGPWALPHPLELRHEIAIKSPGIATGAGRRRRWQETEFTASLDETLIRGAWTTTVHFTTHAPTVEPERLAAFRGRMTEVFKESLTRLFLPWGLARPRRVEPLGALPPPESGESAYVPPPHTDTHRPTPNPARSGEMKLERTSEVRHRRQRSSSSRRRHSRGSSQFDIPPTVMYLIIRLGIFAFFVGLAVLRGCINSTGY